MILPKAVALSGQLIIAIAAGDRVPQLDVEPVCKGIAEQGGVTFRDPAVPQEKKNCIESEQAVREQLVKQWSSFSADDRTHCISETTMGGELSYTELLTCLEMARDVRRAEAGASSRAAATRAPSSPSTPTVQPAGAEPASRPTAANEPPKREVDSALKEMEKAKTGAESAKAPEAMARKLADTEAALQRAKEEAGRAAKEAAQAKADAQVARDLKAQAERKLADAQGQASRSAAKGQPSLGARLRGWLGQHSK